MKIVAILFVVFLCQWSETLAVNCTDRQTEEQLSKCFHANGIFLTADEDDHNIHDIILKNLTVVCGAGEKAYRAAMNCSSGYTSGCLTPRITGPEQINSADKAVQGISFLCRHIQAVNPECTQDAFIRYTLNRCTQKLVSKNSVPAYGTRSNQAERDCMFMEMEYDCKQEYLLPCGSKAVRVVLEYLNEYVRPPFCHSFDLRGDDHFVAEGSASHNHAASLESPSVLVVAFLATRFSWCQSC